MAEQSWKPTRKVTAAGIGVPASIVVVWIVGLFGIEMPPEVAAAVASLISTGLAYFVRDKSLAADG